MDQVTVEAALADLPLGAVRYSDRLGSTQDEAVQWFLKGAPDLALVLADEQTAGKGRLGRRWVTPLGVALAFSLILLPTPTEILHLDRLVGLGALAVAEAVERLYGLRAEIKWPNDVLLSRRKFAGVLTGVEWSEGPQAAILGIGINTSAASIREEVLPSAALNFPATSLETALGRPVDRLELLHAVLQSLLVWRSRLADPEFMQAWEDRLAFKGEWVRVSEALPGDQGKSLEGRVAGLDPNGRLLLDSPNEGRITVNVGDLQLRPEAEPK